MLSTEKRTEVTSKIAAFIGTADIHKVTAQQAYSQLYPDQVDFGFFLQAWQHVLRGETDEKEHAELLTRSTPPVCAKCSAQISSPTEVSTTETGPESAEVKPAVPQNDDPSSSTTQVEADPVPPASVVDASPEKA